MYRSKNLKKLLAFQSFRFLVILEANLCILKNFGFWYFGCFFFSNFKKMLLHKPRTQLFVLWTGLDCFITSVEFTISLSPGNIVSVRWQTMSHCLNWCCLATRRRPPSKTETAVHLNFNLRRHWTSLSFPTTPPDNSEGDCIITTFHPKQPEIPRFIRDNMHSFIHYVSKTRFPTLIKSLFI